MNGNKGKEQCGLICRRELPTKAAAFTLAEVLVVSFILIIIIAAISSLVNISQLSQPISVKKIAVAHQARNVMNWISKDARQTSGYQINNNAPTSDYIKFQLCTGHNGTDLQWNSDFIEYSYDSSSDIIVRNDTGTGQSWQFYDIIASPFDVSRVDEDILGVTIAVEKAVRGTITVGYNLTMEIKLRNG